MWIPSLSQHLLVTTLIKGQPFDADFRRSLGWKHSRVRRAARLARRSALSARSNSRLAKPQRVYVNARPASAERASRSDLSALAKCSSRPLARLIVRSPNARQPSAESPQAPVVRRDYAHAGALPRPSGSRCCTRKSRRATDRQRVLAAACSTSITSEHQRRHGVTAGDAVLAGLAARCAGARGAGLASLGIHARALRRRRP